MEQKKRNIYITRGQKFKNIRDLCLKEGHLFEDPHFKMDDTYKWKRPSEIVEDPQLFVEGISRFDVRQGSLKDCWMVAAISTLALYPHLVEKIFPTDQSFSKDYAGVFHVIIWRFGRLVDIVIDDRLSVKEDGNLAFVKSRQKNEFWPALLEKAYSKIMGGEYSASVEGHLSSALEDFTGGVVKQVWLKSPPKNFETILLTSVNKRSLIGCILPDTQGKTEADLKGLIGNHSYSVTGATRLNIPEHENTVLVRVRNPWGSGEWTGPWSDNSPEWKTIPSKTKDELGLVFETDGEFWMSYSDFISHFEWVDICYLDMKMFSNVPTWRMKQTRGTWVRGITAGGTKEIHMNTQVRLRLNYTDDINADGQCSVIIALIQKPVETRYNYNKIGFRIYYVNDPRYYQTTLDRTFFQYNDFIYEASPKAMRDRVKWLTLLPGVYCVVPFIDEFGKEGAFLLRIYAEDNPDIMTMDRIGLSPEKVKNYETPPMKSLTVDAKKDEYKFAKDLCDQLLTGRTEMGWKELKDALDIAVKKNISTSTELGGEHLLIDIANFIYNRFFGSFSKDNDNAFKTIGTKGFSKNICRSMVDLLDVNHSGKLDSNELHTLGEEIQKFKLIYESYSKDTGGYLKSTRLKEALETSGFQLNNRILGDFVHMYANKDGNIPFDDFLYCVIKLKNASELFKSKEEKDSCKAEFTFEQFIEKVVKCL